MIPNLTGLNPDPAAPVLPAGVTALRDLRDASVLQAAVAGGKRVVVLGGGVLGLETALAAAEEGATVTVVHNGPHPLGRNIDRGGGAVLAASLRNCGVRVAGNARSTGVEHNAPDGGFSALLLDDGSAIDGDLLVLSCGVRPRTELAEGCGLSTAAGILVDHKLRAHHEPHIFAIGDCAEVRCPDPDCVECRTARGPSGLVGPGWRQAEWLAEYLTLLAAGSPEAELVPALPAELPGVVVLKARGMNMAVAGDVSAEPWDEEVLSAGAADGRARLQIAQWADPEHGRYVKMTTRAGVLEGLVAVGMPRIGGRAGAAVRARRGAPGGPVAAAAPGRPGPGGRFRRGRPRAHGVPVRRGERDRHCVRRLRWLRDGGRGFRCHPCRDRVRRLP